ncbi:MAG TPA: hypothetical protein VER32_14920 [Pyrinomonadaceae bacterium]|nr:hypothetical protein [Pyrinomonadaceae bacterium]
MGAPAVQQANSLWWNLMPSAASRVSLALSAVWGDGLYLSARPLVGALVPPLAFLVGLLTGWLHPGFAGEEIFSASLLVMGLMTAAGAFSSAAGWWMLVGYTLGDFFLYKHYGYLYFHDSLVRQLVYARAPLLIPYLLLAMLLVFIPLFSRALRVQTLSSVSPGKTVVGPATIILQALVQGALVLVWAHAVPTLIRPVYTWRGDYPSVEVVQPLQESWWVLVVLAALCGGARVVVERRAMARPDVARRAAELREALKRAAATPRRRLPDYAAVALKAAFATFILSGVLGKWLDALALAVVLALLLLARRHLATHMRAWTRMISGIPLLLRLAIGTAINYFFAKQIIAALWDSTSTFRPVLISVVVSLVIFSLLVPDVGERTRNRFTKTSRANSPRGEGIGDAV